VNLINQGTISADVSGGTLIIHGQTVNNQGTIAVVNGNLVSIVGSIDLSGLAVLNIELGGTMQVSGSVSGNTANAAQFVASGSLILNGSGTSSSPQLWK